MSVSMPWPHTRDALRNFMEILTCMKCKNRPIIFKKYTTCDHHFCNNCTYNVSECFVCGVHVQPTDIIHDFITESLASVCDSIFDIVFDNGDAESSQDDADPNEQDGNKNEEQEKSVEQRTSSHKSSEIDTNLEDLLQHDLLSSTRFSKPLIQNQRRTSMSNVVEEALIESDEHNENETRREAENQSRIEEKSVTPNQNKNARKAENTKERLINISIEIKQRKKENREFNEEQNIEDVEEIEKETEIVNQAEIAKQLKKQKEKEKREIAKQKKIEKQNEMEKENNARSTRKRRGQIDIIRFRSDDSHLESDESIKKKKVENLKEVEKQKEIEIAKFRNVERRRRKVNQREEIVEQPKIVGQSEIVEETQDETIDEQEMEIGEQQIPGQTNSRDNTDLDDLLRDNISSSTRLSKGFHGTRSRQMLSNITEETSISAQSNKIDNSANDTVILNESDQLDESRSVFQEPKSVKPSTSKSSRKTTRSRSNSLTKTPTVPKNVNKKNRKGETLLHQACVKGQEETVKMLLDNGANPNTKDNACWTPLQEAINMGYYRICEILLEKGALPNTPGIDNKTALHEAVKYNRVKETKLLLSFDANPNAVDQNGKKPIDYCQSDEIRKLLSQENLLNDSRDLSFSSNSSFVSTASKIIVFACNLQQSNKESLSKLAVKHKFKIVNSFQSDITHVVVESDQIFFTYDILLSVLHGKWILSSEWIEIGLSPECDDLREMDLDIFEMKFRTNEETPRHARLNAEHQNPKLFNNCSFYFAMNSMDSYYVGLMELSKKHLINLCLAGGGCSLSREPNPEGITDQRIPFHVAELNDHPLQKCSHYIIYSPGKDEPRIKYNMPHIKSLPLVWFIECIEKFTLVDPTLFGM